MSETELTDEEHLLEQIGQVREAVISIENKNKGIPSMHPEELWSVMEVRMDEKKTMHPRLVQMLKGHADVNEVKRGLKRLENDLEDLNRDSTELYDPPKHSLDEEDDSPEWESNTPRESDGAVDENGEAPTSDRDTDQRPLSAYQNVDS